MVFLAGDTLVVALDKEIRPHIDELETGQLPPYDITRKLLSTFGVDAMAKDALEKVLPPDPEDDDETEEPEDPDTPDAEDDDDDDEDPKGGVTSDQRGAAPSADAAPILGEEWTKALTVVVSEALETVLKAAGVELPPPPSDPEARAADMLVTEIQLMELGPSE